MRHFIVIAAVCVCAWSGVRAANLPSTFKRCQVSSDLDNKPNQCLKEAIYDAIVQLSNGNQELGVDTLDPLKVKKVTIEQGENSPVAVKLAFRNCELRGIKNLEVDSITGHPSSADTFYLKGTGRTPRLTLVGPYKVTGKVLILPIQGAGQSNLTLDDVKAEFTVKGEAQMKNGIKYLKLKSVKLNIKTISRLWISLEGLFNSDKALGDNMNVFLNQNWQDIFAELRPGMNNAFASVVEDYTRKIMENVPFQDIFIAG